MQAHSSGKSAKVTNGKLPNYGAWLSSPSCSTIDDDKASASSCSGGTQAGTCSNSSQCDLERFITTLLTGIVALAVAWELLLLLPAADDNTNGTYIECSSDETRVPDRELGRRRPADDDRGRANLAATSSLAPLPTRDALTVPVVVNETRGPHYRMPAITSPVENDNVSTGEVHCTSDQSRVKCSTAGGLMTTLSSAADTSIMPSSSPIDLRVPVMSEHLSASRDGTFDGPLPEVRATADDEGKFLVSHDKDYIDDEWLYNADDDNTEDSGRTSDEDFESTESFASSWISLFRTYLLNNNTQNFHSAYVKATDNVTKEQLDRTLSTISEESAGESVNLENGGHGRDHDSTSVQTATSDDRKTVHTVTSQRLDCRDCVNDTDNVHDGTQETFNGYSKADLFTADKPFVR